MTLDIGQTAMELYLEGPAAGIDFQVDTMSLVKVEHIPDGIIIDPGFEEPLSASNWQPLGDCKGTRVGDAHSGNNAYLASHRYVQWLKTLCYTPWIFAEIE